MQSSLRSVFCWYHDTQYNDIQPNGIQHSNKKSQSVKDFQQSYTRHNDSRSWVSLCQLSFCWASWRHLGTLELRLIVRNFVIVLQASFLMDKLMLQPGKSYWRGRLSTVDLLELTSLHQLLFILKIVFTLFTKQGTLMRRSTVLSLLPQLVFPVLTKTIPSNKTLVDC